MIRWPFVLRSTMERHIRHWSGVAALRDEPCFRLSFEVMAARRRILDAEHARDAAVAELAKFARKRGAGGKFIKGNQ